MSLLRIAIVIALATSIAFVFACGGDTESIDSRIRRDAGSHPAHAG